MPPTASFEDIRRANRRIRDIYGAESIAISGLYDPASLEAVHRRLDLAYTTLMDAAKRKDYDHRAVPRRRADAGRRRRRTDATSRRRAPPAKVDDPATARDRARRCPRSSPRTEFSGPLLRQIREAIGVELREIAERSKIGMAYLHALEGEVFAKLPAPVYVRGFLARVRARARPRRRARQADLPRAVQGRAAVARRRGRRRRDRRTAEGLSRPASLDLARDAAPTIASMATLIDNPKRARQLARAIASDLTLYHEPKILEGIANDNLFDVMSDEINEGRELFKSRVTEDIFGQHIYERAIVDVLVKSKGHVKSKIW